MPPHVVMGPPPPPGYYMRQQAQQEVPLPHQQPQQQQLQELGSGGSAGRDPRLISSAALQAEQTMVVQTQQHMPINIEFSQRRADSGTMPAMPAVHQIPQLRPVVIIPPKLVEKPSIESQKEKTLNNNKAGSGGQRDRRKEGYITPIAGAAAAEEEVEEDDEIQIVSKVIAPPVVAAATQPIETIVITAPEVVAPTTSQPTRTTRSAAKAAATTAVPAEEKVEAVPCEDSHSPTAAKNSSSPHPGPQPRGMVGFKSQNIGILATQRPFPSATLEKEPRSEPSPVAGMAGKTIEQFQQPSPSARGLADLALSLSAAKADSHEPPGLLQSKTSPEAVNRNSQRVVERKLGHPKKLDSSKEQVEKEEKEKARRTQEQINAEKLLAEKAGVEFKGIAVNPAHQIDVTTSNKKGIPPFPTAALPTVTLPTAALPTVTLPTAALGSILPGLMEGPSSETLRQELGAALLRNHKGALSKQSLSPVLDSAAGARPPQTMSNSPQPQQQAGTKTLPISKPLLETRAPPCTTNSPMGPPQQGGYYMPSGIGPPGVVGLNPYIPRPTSTAPLPASGAFPGAAFYPPRPPLPGTPSSLMMNQTPILPFPNQILMQRPPYMPLRPQFPMQFMGNGVQKGFAMGPPMQKPRPTYPNNPAGCAPGDAAAGTRVHPPMQPQLKSGMPPSTRNNAGALPRETSKNAAQELPSANKRENQSSLGPGISVPAHLKRRRTYVIEGSAVHSSGGTKDSEGGDGGGGGVAGSETKVALPQKTSHPAITPDRQAPAPTQLALQQTSLPTTEEQNSDDEEFEGAPEDPGYPLSSPASTQYATASEEESEDEIAQVVHHVAAPAVPAGRVNHRKIRKPEALPTLTQQQPYFQTQKTRMTPPLFYVRSPPPPPSAAEENAPDSRPEISIKIDTDNTSPALHVLPSKKIGKYPPLPELPPQPESEGPPIVDLASIKSTPAPPHLHRAHLLKESPNGQPIARWVQRVSDETWLDFLYVSSTVERFNVLPEMPPMPRGTGTVRVPFWPTPGVVKLGAKVPPLLKMFTHDITVIDALNNAWPVVFEGVECNKQRHNRLGGAWPVMVQAAGVSVGDRIALERWNEDRKIVHFVVLRDDEEDLKRMGPPPPTAKKSDLELLKEFPGSVCVITSSEEEDEGGSAANGSGTARKKDYSRRSKRRK